MDEYNFNTFENIIQFITEGYPVAYSDYELREINLSLLNHATLLPV